MRNKLLRKRRKGKKKIGKMFEKRQRCRKRGKFILKKRQREKLLV